MRASRLLLGTAAVAALASRPGLYVNPAWADVQEGDRFVSVPGRAWFDVVHAEPGRSLVLRAALDLRGRPFDPAGPRPYAFVDARWEFFLDPRADGSTRILVRFGAVGAPRWLTDVLNYGFAHPAHVIMQVRQLHQIRARAEDPGAQWIAATGRRDAPDETAVARA